MSKANDVNPRMQCERCGKWRRLITRGVQCMHPFYDDMEDFVGKRSYDCICVWCVKELKDITEGSK